MEDLRGRELAGCVIKELRGGGGMGAVYRAHQKKLGRDVAIKVLERSELAGTDDGEIRIRRFEQEARAVASLNHPNVMAVYDYGESDNLIFMVMELVEGTSLGERLRGGHRSTPLEVMQVGAQAARGLAAAHHAGLIHRDIKPDNLLRTEAGQIKVADFGLAKPVVGDIHLTHTQTVVGSPAYMSPEQCQGDALTTASDVYSLGVTLYSLLEGHAPFEGTSAVAVMFRHVNDVVTYSAEIQDSAPQDLLAILDRAMAKDPKERWESTTAMATVLERIAAGGKLTPEERLGIGGVSGRLVVGSKPRWQMPAAVGGAVVLLVGFLWFAFSDRGVDSTGDGNEQAKTSPSPSGDGAGVGDGDVSAKVGAAASSPGANPVAPVIVEGLLPVAVQSNPAGDEKAAGSDSPSTTPEPAVATVPSGPDLSELRARAKAATNIARDGDPAAARRELEEIAAIVDLKELSPEADAMLIQLREYEMRLAEAKAAIVAADLEAALVAANDAHKIFRTLETTRLATRLRLVSKQLADLRTQAMQDDLAAVHAGLATALASEDAPFFSSIAKEINSYGEMRDAAEAAWNGGEWSAARDALELAQAVFSSRFVEERLLELDAYEAAMERGRLARSAGELAQALVEFEEAKSAIASEEVEKLIVATRFEIALGAIEAAEDPQARLIAMEAALAIRADSQLEQEIAALRSTLKPSADDLVNAAMKRAADFESRHDLKSALAELMAVSGDAQGASAELRAQHGAAVGRLQSALHPPEPRWQSIARANQLYAEADKLRRTPMTIFSDKNEQQALMTYEQIFRDYPRSDKVPEAYFYAAHMAENLNQYDKAIQYWIEAAKAGYSDPVECYMQAGDTAEDDLRDRARAAGYFSMALSACNDIRREKIQKKLQELR